MCKKCLLYICPGDGMSSHNGLKHRCRIRRGGASPLPGITWACNSMVECIPFKDNTTVQFCPGLYEEANSTVSRDPLRGISLNYF